MPILLVSARCFVSDFFTEDELPVLRQAADDNAATMLPVMVSASRFAQESALYKFQAMNPPEQPLDSLPAHEVNHILQRVAEHCEECFRVTDQPAVTAPKPQPVITPSPRSAMTTRPEAGQPLPPSCTCQTRSLAATTVQAIDQCSRRFQLRRPDMRLASLTCHMVPL